MHNCDIAAFRVLLWNQLKHQTQLGKKKPPSPPPNLKGKLASQFECMLGPLHRLHEISLPEKVSQHFWPGLVQELPNGGTYSVSY
jgi:hypothetical protein